MNSLFVGIAFLLLTSTTVLSQNQIILLWPIGPGQQKDEKESLKKSNITEVHQPTLTVFLPGKSDANHPAILVCPGGGYRQIVIDKEGYTIARWLNDNGIAAFVLTYRLHRDTALLDAQRAMSIVRSKAREFNIDPERIGVMGFSAGAHLSLNAATRYKKVVRRDDIDTVDGKPNFMVLVYGSFQDLISQVNRETPPAFLAHASDDERVPAVQSIDLFLALRNHGVPAELHIYEKGGHGFALVKERGPVVSWAQRCIDWMKCRGIMTGR